MSREVSAEPLWRPSLARIQGTHYARFVSQSEIGQEITPESAAKVYRDLHRWSIERPGDFWRQVWQHSRLRGDLGSPDYDASQPIWNRPFFPEGTLNFAENILRPDRFQELDFANSVAIVAIDETGSQQSITRKELANRVGKLADYFRSSGIVPGDRIAAVLPNRIEAIIGLLASSSVGAVWSCCSPDFGDDALLDRFEQIAPTILISATSAQYAGKKVDVQNRVSQLLQRLPSVQHCILVDDPGSSKPQTAKVVNWSEIQAIPATDLQFESLPFNHPLYILYSSGTTGKPKCLVHGAGGSLLQHCKEHLLHLDIQSSDCLMYYTSTGWMMWNWLVSGLATAGTIVIYDGSPIFPSPDVLWKIADESRVTHLGASARYYAALEKEGYSPKDQVNLDRLRCLLSTGSPLLPEQFRWIYQSIKSDIHLSSISGGTDIVSCFVLGNPTLPVFAGEIQCIGLGMDVRVVDTLGKPLIEEPGELVCANAFPSMPIGFWNDPQRTKYREAYFDRYPNMWWHGDWTVQTANGGFVIYGRSDATLNPGGVRIGTGEIYQQLESFPEIAEALATVIKRDGDEKIVLFLKLVHGHILSDGLVEQIKLRLRQKCSPRHSPAFVVAVPDLPKTLSGKLSEIAVRNALLGREIGNAGALANPNCLKFFEEWVQQIPNKQP